MYWQALDQHLLLLKGTEKTDGVVVDGYISGAEVCIDEDDWTCDTDFNNF